MQAGAGAVVESYVLMGKKGGGEGRERKRCWVWSGLMNLTVHFQLNTSS